MSLVQSLVVFYLQLVYSTVVVDSIVFGTCVRELVIVMDNASFHKDKQLLLDIVQAGHVIEHKWAEKKAYPRKIRCSVEDCYAYIFTCV